MYTKITCKFFNSRCGCAQLVSPSEACGASNPLSSLRIVRKSIATYEADHIFVSMILFPISISNFLLKNTFLISSPAICDEIYAQSDLSTQLPVVMDQWHSGTLRYENGNNILHIVKNKWRDYLDTLDRLLYTLGSLNVELPLRMLKSNI